ncbi:hypothetical protein ACFOHH_18810, partial [Shinella pollutisoli]
MRASRSGRILNNSDAALVKGMIARGDRQHDIAAYFGVNGGRIGEASTGENFSGVAAATTNLPPPSPYLVVPADMRVRAERILGPVDKVWQPYLCGCQGEECR